MTDKVTLTNLVNLQNETTAVNAINANNAAITTAMNNTLSRDGTSPNPLTATLDANSNRILNLPKPITANEPLRLTELNTFVGGGTITNIPAGGTTGQVLAKTSGTDYAVGWTSESAELTAGNNIVLTGTTPTTIATTTAPSFTGTANIGTLNVGTNVALPSGTAFAVNKNAAALPVQSFAGETWMARVAGADGTAPIVSVEAYGSFPALIFQRADGTGAAPTAVQSGELIGAVTGHAYGSTAFNGAAAQLRLHANQTWTDAAQGTNMAIWTTPNGSTASSVGPVIQFENDKGITVPPSVTGGSKGAGTINLSGSLYDNGTAPTGTSGYVRSTSPTLVTPTLGAATATSVNKVALTAPATAATLTMANNTTLTTTSSTSVGAGQYLATSTNDTATAGNIGEFVTSTVLTGSAVTLSTGVTSNVTSISLTAGDWDVYGGVMFLPGATTNATFLDGAISTTTATFPTQDGLSYTQWSSTGTVIGATSFSVPTNFTRISVSGTTTVFLVANATFTVSTMKAFGTISARRAR